MRIVVTGASGFIGDALLAHLGDDVEVHAVSRREPSGLRPGQHWIEGDLMSGAFAGRLPATADVVVHLAVSYRHREFPESALDLFGVNTASAAVLLDYARRAGVGHFVLGSTGSVYPATGRADQREDSPPRPGEYFSTTKLAAEQLAAHYTSMFDVFVPRLFFPYGRGQRDRLVPSLVDSVRSGLPIVLTGTDDGLTICPTHIGDVVAVLLAAIEERWTGTVNVAAPETLTLRQIGMIIGEHVGREPVFEQRPGGSPLVFAPSLDELRARFDVAGMVRFRDGLTDVLAG